MVTAVTLFLTIVYYSVFKGLSKHHLWKSQFEMVFSFCMKLVVNGHYLPLIDFAMSVADRDKHDRAHLTIEIEVDYRIWDEVQLARHIMFHHSKGIPNR